MKEKIKIYIAAHKKFDFVFPDVYCPMHVGKEGKKSLGYKGDNTGDNISNKNASFCELTGMYWIWKNSKYDIVGLVHYRRWFYNSIFSSKKKVLSESNIKKILNKYDIIVAPKGYTWKSSVYDQYKNNHFIDDLEKCHNILKEKYPEYEQSYQKIMYGNCYSPLNMVITHKKIFDEYCEWLFSILFELEKQIDLSKRDSYNMRVFGFLSERLFNVWLGKNIQYKIIEKPVLNIEKNVLKQRIQHIVKKVIK